MSAMGRQRPVETFSDLSTWAPAMLAEPLGFGQKQTVVKLRLIFNLR
jgi:hypothetical protein